jgi:N-acetylneuraminate lyase
MEPKVCSSCAERQTVFRVVAEESRPKAKLIGHLGALSTKEAILLAETCLKLGYDAISAIPPIYFPYASEDIRDYYRAIIDAASGIPLMLYNIPVLSGRKFSLSELGELVELPGVIGVKQTDLDMYRMEQLRRRYPELLLLNGYDEVLLAGLISGADGGVGSTYNIMGWRYRDETTRSLRARKLSNRRRSRLRINPRPRVVRSSAAQINLN